MLLCQPSASERASGLSLLISVQSSGVGCGNGRAKEVALRAEAASMVLEMGKTESAADGSGQDVWDVLIKPQMSLFQALGIGVCSIHQL